MCYYVDMQDNQNETKSGFTLQLSHLKEEAITDIITNYIYEAFYAGDLVDEDGYNLYDSHEQAVEDDDLRLETKLKLEEAFPASI